MTDGIIQKVFHRYAYRLGSRITSKDVKMLFELQQELIEEIIKEFPITKPFVHVHGNHIIQQKLIGDNQYVLRL